MFSLGMAVVGRVDLVGRGACMERVDVFGRGRMLLVGCILVRLVIGGCYW